MEAVLRHSATDSDVLAEDQQFFQAQINALTIVAFGRLPEKSNGCFYFT